MTNRFILNETSYHGAGAIKEVGGFRASCYNAQTMEGVQALVKAMQDFEAQH